MNNFISNNLPLIVFMILMLFFAFLFAVIDVPRDNTDSAEKRSGFTLLTDHGTGCQYLYYWYGLVKRTNKAGEHVGCE